VKFRSLTSGVLGMFVLATGAPLAAQADSYLAVDFISLRGDAYETGISSFARALEVRPELENFHIWEVPSRGYEVTLREIQVVFFDDVHREHAREVGRTLTDLSNNPVCIMKETASRKEGLGELNVYLPADLDTDRLAGGPNSGRSGYIGACQERRNVSDPALDRDPTIASVSLDATSTY